MKTILSSLLIVLLLLGGCAVNPVTGKQNFTLMSEAEEIELGRKLHKRIIADYGVYQDPELQTYVNRVGQELAAKSHRAHIGFTFTLLDSPEINAFALPGGYIYLTRGILAYLNSEAELAGVLGHEIGHVTARHSVRQQAGQFASDLLSVLITATTGERALGDLSQTLGAGLVRGYGREHELEADRLGAEYLHNVGYNPENMLDVIGVLKDQEVYERALAKQEQREPNIYHGVFSTHPRNDERLKTVVRAAKKLSAQDYRDDNRRRFHSEIDGLAWGPSIKQGVVANNRFSHPELAISFALPPGWKVDNRREFLLARDEKTGAVLQIEVQTRDEDESLGGFLRRLSRDQKLKVIKDDYGVTAKTEALQRGGAKQPARISAMALAGRQVLTLLGTANGKSFAKIDPKLIKVNHSLNRLTPEQASAIKSPRLRIVERSAQNFSALANQSAIGYDAESILRLLNRRFPNGDITSLDKLKTVTIDE